MYNIYYSAACIRERDNCPGCIKLHARSATGCRICYPVFICAEKHVFCISHCCFADSHRTSFPDIRCIADQFSGKGDHAHHSLLGRTVFWFWYGRKFNQEISKTGRNMFPAGEESIVYLFSVTYICFFARGCGKFISRCYENSISTLLSGRYTGDNIRSCFIHNSRFKHQRAGITRFYTFRLSNGICSNHFNLAVHT